MDKPQKKEEEAQGISFAERVKNSRENGTPIKDIPSNSDPNPVRQAIAFIHKLWGLNLPEEEDFMVISNFLRTGAFKNRTIEELREAAFSCVNGWIDEVVPYRGITPDFIKRLFHVYDEKAKRIRAHNTQKLPEADQFSDEQKKENRRKILDDIVKDFDSLKEGDDIATVPIPHKFSILIEIGAAEQPPKEDRARLMDAAKENLKRKKAQKGGGIRNLIQRSTTVKGEAKIMAYKEALLNLARNGKDIRDFIEKP
jgi:hypothetical protein